MLRTAFRGLGHVFAISRGLSTFQHPEASPDADAMSQSDDGGGGAFANGAAGAPAEETGIRWTGNVGADLRRDEQCQFESVG